MYPVFQPDDYVVICRRLFTPYQTGDIVVVQHPSLGLIIKRIVSIDPQQQISLAGENPASTSSQAIGLINKKQLVGRVIWRIAARRAKH
ncbi:hypothetical protein FME95_08620 [Reinekea thalattae]|uniref:Peptidase S24/S26A/S26B/S26C domain-containing protein n=2 Tax=Reinekea thalattae TaxID=2593301 RepID=A0A5C8ZBP7_9GAMM|nr:hypothetical protein FME95_08620 [Reinekea thalattae]